MVRRALLLLTLSLSPACSFLVDSDDLIDGPSSAGGEAGVAIPDGGPRCADASVCDDFEGAGTITWRATTTGNASVVVDAVKPRGGARGLHASRAPAAGQAAAYLEFTPAGTLRFCELDVLATSMSGQYLSVFNFGFDSVDAPFTSYSLSMQIGGSVAQFGARGASPALYTDVYVPALALGRWVHVRIDFDWTSSASALVLSVDGALQPRFPITPPKGSKPFVQIGMTYAAEQANGWDVFVDNVVCGTSD
jgi:hypothetical protein